MWKCCVEVDIMTYGLHAGGCLNNKMAKTKCSKQGLFVVLWQAQTKGYESRVGMDGNKAENGVSGRLITSPCARQAIGCVFSQRGRPTFEPDDPLLRDPNEAQCTKQKNTHRV